MQFYHELITLLTVDAVCYDPAFGHNTHDGQCLHQHEFGQGSCVLHAHHQGHGALLLCPTLCAVPRAGIVIIGFLSGMS